MAPNSNLATILPPRADGEVYDAAGRRVPVIEPKVDQSVSELPNFKIDIGDVRPKTPSPATQEYDPIVDAPKREPVQPNTDEAYSPAMLKTMSDGEIDTAYNEITANIWNAEKSVTSDGNPAARGYLNKAYSWQANLVDARHSRGLNVQSDGGNQMSIKEFSRSEGVDPAITDTLLLERRNMDPQNALPHTSVTGGEKTGTLKTDEMRMINGSMQPITQQYPTVESDVAQSLNTANPEPRANGLLSSVKSLKNDINKRGFVDKYVPEAVKKRMRAVGNKVITFAFAKSLELSAKNHVVSEHPFSMSGGNREAEYLPSTPPMPGIEYMLTTKPVKDSKYVDDRHDSAPQTKSNEQPHDRQSLIQEVAYRLGTSTEDVASRVRRLADSNHEVMVLDGPNNSNDELRIMFPTEDGTLQFMNNPNTLAAALTSA